MLKYEIVSGFGCKKVEAEDDKSRREIIEDFLKEKNINYKILDEHDYGEKHQLTQFHLLIDGEEDELEIIIQ